MALGIFLKSKQKVEEKSDQKKTSVCMGLYMQKLHCGFHPANSPESFGKRRSSLKLEE